MKGERSGATKWSALVVGVSLVLSLAFYGLVDALGTQPGPHVDNASAADVVARVESLGRGTVTVEAEVTYDVDVVTLDVIEQQPLLPDAPVPPPRLGDTVTAAVHERASWWENGVDDGELVVFLDHGPERGGTAWGLLFAVDARTGRIAGEFDDDWSQDTYAALVAQAGAGTPQERIDALLAWARSGAEQRPDGWTVEQLGTFYFGEAVARDVEVDRDQPFGLAAWQALPADERLLPVGPDDPALQVLQTALGLQSVAVAVRPNGAFDVPVSDVAVEFVGTGLLGWIPLVDGQPTGLVGAAPTGEDGRVRVLGRTAAGDIRVLQQFGDGNGAERSVPLWSIRGGMAEPGPWALVIDLEATADGGDGVALRQTSIDELGLLVERAGR